MVSQRVKYAMAHLSHKQHISQLARPNWRRIQRMDMNILPKPFATSRAALRSRASKRIKVMAQPKFLNKKYDPAKAPSQQPRIHPKTLTAKSSRRIMDLALPKKGVLLTTMKYAMSNKTMSENLSNLLWRLKKSRYQRYRFFCNARQKRDFARRKRLMAKLRKNLSKPEDWQKHLQVLERLAAPKVLHRRKPPGRRRKWRPVNMHRVEELAQPVSRASPEIRDPFKVPRSALTYQISSRVKEIAFRKNPPEIIQPRIPGAVSAAAMRAVASPRTIILAKPAVRPAGIETDLREDAFTVSPAALKAKCSKRLKILARAKTYGK
ncbi:hypothetical protein KM043_005643 [Ampulex compressa]|nr:hypothetical protein KM043_005643 [Ampulex compressa]